MRRITEDDKRNIRNTVIAGVIVAAVAGVMAKFPGVLGWVVKICSRVWSHLMSNVPVPLYVVYPLAAAAGIWLTRRIVRFGTRMSPHSYTSDIFQGVRWRWGYSYNLQPYGVWCFCPDDMTTLVYSESRYPDETFLHCETCGHRWGPFKGDHIYVTEMIARQIARKITTSEWIQVVENSEAASAKTRSRGDTHG